MPTDIERLRELLAAGAPSLVNGKASPKVISEMISAGQRAQRPQPKDMSDFRPDADAALITETINALPALLDDVERLREYHASVEDLVSTWMGGDTPAQFYPNGRGDCDDDDDEDRWDRFVAARASLT